MEARLKGLHTQTRLETLSFSFAGLISSAKLLPGMISKMIHGEYNTNTEGEPQISKCFGFVCLCVCVCVCVCVKLNAPVSKPSPRISKELKYGNLRLLKAVYMSIRRVHTVIIFLIINKPLFTCICLATN